MSKKPVIAFVHQNIPAQFRNLAPAMAASGHDVYFITAGQNEVKGTIRVQYKIDVKGDEPHIAQIKYASSAAKAFLHLKDKLNVTPDIIIGHIGWGEMMFLRDLFPKVPSIGYFEYFLRESFTNFDADYVSDANGPFVLRSKNIPAYVCADTCDVGMTPTYFQ